MKHKKEIPKPNFKLDELTIVLIVALFAVFVSVYEGSRKINSIDAEKITGLILDSHEISFASGGVVDKDKLRQVQGMDYTKLKNYLNVKQDFCVYLEDENGNVILAKSSPDLGKDSAACSKQTE